MSLPLDAATLVEGQAGSPQDRVGIFPVGNAVVVAVADGSGGIGDGAAAAKTVIATIRSVAARGPDLQNAARLLADAARLPSSRLQDDVGLVLCRPQIESRK